MIDCTGFVVSIKVVGRNRASLSERHVTYVSCVELQ
jgi:hypothetical protein